MTHRTLTGRLYVSICLNFLLCCNFIFDSRAVFGYDGKTNDLKVAETGGMHVLRKFLDLFKYFNCFQYIFLCYEIETFSWIVLFAIWKRQVYFYVLDNGLSNLNGSGCLPVFRKGCDVHVQIIIFWKSVAV